MRASSQPAPASASSASAGHHGVRRQRAEDGAAAPDQPQADRQDDVAVGEGLGAVPDRDDRVGGAEIQRRTAPARPAPAAAAMLAGRACARRRAGRVRVGRFQEHSSLASMRARLLGQLYSCSTLARATGPMRRIGVRSAAPRRWRRSRRRPAASSRSVPGIASMPSSACGDTTTGVRHRHRFEHLVLDAARDAQRRHRAPRRGRCRAARRARCRSPPRRAAGPAPAPRRTGRAPTM